MYVSTESPSKSRNAIIVCPLRIRKFAMESCSDFGDARTHFLAFSTKFAPNKVPIRISGCDMGISLNPEEVDTNNPPE
jgi:hypothetical protein